MATDPLSSYEKRKHLLRFIHKLISEYEAGSHLETAGESLTRLAEIEKLMAELRNTHRFSKE